MSNTATALPQFVFNLTQEEFLQFDKLVGELPTKFGLPFIQFAQAVTQKRKAEASLRQATEDQNAENIVK